MEGWTSMTELNLSTNQLRVLPDDIDKLINLEVILDFKYSGTQVAFIYMKKLCGFLYSNFWK